MGGGQFTEEMFEELSRIVVLNCDNQDTFNQLTIQYLDAVVSLALTLLGHQR